MDIVKIDPAFVTTISESPAASAVVASVTHLAHFLSIAVTAEGVETTAQRDEVVRAGCEYAQGFHFYRPMPAPEVSAQLG